MATRKEHDFIGELEISDDVYYGVQTFRAVENFKMTGRQIKDYPFFVKAFAQIKKAAALANKEVGVLCPERADAIAKAADEIIAGKYHDQFVVDMIQGGAGTSTNMNTNEVITNVALEILGHKKGEYKYLHANDHTNLGQSTNDTYPSSIKVATYAKLTDLLKAMELLKSELEKKGKEFKDMIKMGRTELEDAVPTTLGNTFNAFASYIKADIENIKKARELMSFLNMGATAIGTGINCHPDYKCAVHKHLSKITGAEFKPAENFIAATQDTADFVQVSGSLKTAAVRLSKIANDFELNAFEPGIAYALFNSLVILENAYITLAEKAIKNVQAKPENCLNLVLNSVGIVTAFNPVIGYENSASIAKEALNSGKSVGDIAIERGLLTKAEVDKLLDPKSMLNPHMSHTGKDK